MAVSFGGVVGAGLSGDAEMAGPPLFPYNLRASLSTWPFYKIFLTWLPDS